MRAPRVVLLTLLGLAFTALAHAQAEPVRILVGFAAGGTADVIARLVADRLKISLGSPVVVENRPGATGFIAAEALKNAAPNGKTLLISPSAVMVFAPLTYGKLRFDPIRDFAPVSLAAMQTFVLAVGPGSPAKTLRDYIAWVRLTPANAAYGVPGVGGPPHFLGLVFARAIKADLVLVPYKGGAPLATDLVGGQVPASIAVLSDLIQHHRTGKVRMLANSGSERTPAAQDVPTFKELGFPTMESTAWQGFYTVARTPRATIDRLAQAIAVAIKTPEVNERLMALGLNPVGSAPDELARRQLEELERWAPIVKASGFRADE